MSRAAWILWIGRLAAGLGLLAPAVALAQDGYPSRPVQMIVPYAPSGGTDFVARQVANGLSRRLGQQVLVVNRPGAATIVGSELVAKAKPDGHTLLMTSFPLAANPSLYASLPYDSRQDFAPISLITNAPTVLVANPALPVRSAADLVMYATTHPDQLNYASYGIGSGAHLAAELFRLATGVKLVHVAYQGGGPAAAAVVSGESQLLFSSALPVLSSIEGGLLRAIAVAADRRLAALPDVPTFRESGVDYVTGTWFGLLAPAHTPVSIIARIHEDVSATLADTGLRAQLAAQGADVVAGTPEEFARFIADETRRWADVIARAGIPKQ